MQIPLYVDHELGAVYRHSMWNGALIHLTLITHLELKRYYHLRLDLG